MFLSISERAEGEQFRNDIELKWNYDLLNAEALNVAVNGMIPSEHTNNFKLNITAV